MCLLTPKVFFTCEHTVNLSINGNLNSTVNLLSNGNLNKAKIGIEN